MSWQRTVENELKKPTHQNLPFCDLCAVKLKDVHPELIQFVSFVRSKNNAVHVSCGVRTQAEQDKAFKEGTSKKRFPNSKHNRYPSEAVDLFTIDLDGNARFAEHQYRLIWEMSKGAFSITWGGLWITFKDFPHFELIRHS